MTRFVVLRGASDLAEDALPRSHETCRDPERLLERIRNDPGQISWVAIAPDISDASALAQQIRAADPKVNVVLLAPHRDATEGVDWMRSAESGDAVAALRRAHDAEKLASINALTAGIAHDVGTPMTAILGYAELIAKSAGDDKNRKRATTIVEQVHRVSGMIETLMKLSRTEEHPFRPVELGDVIDQALDSCREQLERRGIEIVRELGAAPAVSGDPVRLHQVLRNLLLNAIEAMPDGGTLRVALAENGTGEAELCVSDTGSGIDPELRARIFDPYVSTKPRSRGTGLGLLVAKTIVEKHGGRIALSSASRRGTEFRLTFPPHGPARPDEA